jgi:hypothetical protein
MKRFAIAAAGTAGLLWIGVRVKLRPFPPYPEETPPLDTVPLPAGLPAPVARFFRVAIGDRVPLITSAVLTGRVPMRLAGITVNGRFRFTHRAGRDYRHYIEVGLFGHGILRVNERYVDGVARTELPFGTVEDEPTLEQAANLGLWAESIWLPSILLTDPRVRWEPVGDTVARLIVPFEGGEDSFTVTFDPQSSVIASLEAMRHKNPGGPKIRWIVEPRGWAKAHGMLLPVEGAVTWEDEGRPWAVFRIEDAAYNVDVDGYVRARGL